MSKPTRQAIVLSKQSIGRNITRLSLGGEDLNDFPDGFEGGYVKLIFEDFTGKKTSRSFTVRRHDSDQGTIDIDLLVHGDEGIAAGWLSEVTVSDKIEIGGPGPCKRLNPEADWCLFAGDSSAMPAIAVNLEKLPENERGYAIIEVTHPSDQLDLRKPKNVEIIWLVNPVQDSVPNLLFDAVKDIEWLAGKPSIWVAGEFGVSRSLRQYFRHEKKIEKDFMYVSSYWKLGLTDEGMKAAKHNDPEPW